jgi:hypothetical protein
VSALVASTAFGSVLVAANDLAEYGKLIYFTASSYASPSGFLAIAATLSFALNAASAAIAFNSASVGGFGPAAVAPIAGIFFSASYSGTLALGAFILSRGVGAGFLASFAGTASTGFS